ncbi:MAG: AAA family ATPase [Pigmentiphaga sp.]|uniref:AAA family ATPase n=1 Tax=Pigmentiphaga sp. TaxID=1977564 RepID=UPI003B555E5B
MQVVSIISTKGGVGKTTTAANLGGFIADAGLRVLLLDLDVQPTLSSYFTLGTHAPAGIYEMLAFNEQRIEQLASQTAVAGLDLVVSNDHRGELNTLLLHAPDGRLRLRHLLPALASHYDLLLIDTQGARSVLLEMAVLASSLALSPVTPEILAARELRRGTLQLIEDIAPYRHLGIEPPPLPDRFQRLKHEQQSGALVALRQVDEAQRQAVLDEWEARCCNSSVRNPAGYLFGIIQKAIRGEFKAWAGDSATVPPASRPPAPAPAPSAPPVSPEVARAHLARLRAALRDP